MKDIYFATVVVQSVQWEFEQKQNALHMKNAYENIFPTKGKKIKEGKLTQNILQRNIHGHK